MDIAIWLETSLLLGPKPSYKQIYVLITVLFVHFEK